MQRTLIALGLLAVALGVFWPWVSRLPIGRLPGDILIDRPGLKVFIPLTTMILISLLVSLIAWLFRR
jgi:hypothetical protein